MTTLSTMPSLTKGQNGPLSTSQIVVSVELATATDVSALLVTDRGVVRSDNDFVFYNQPTGPGVSLQQAPNGPARLHISTNEIPRGHRRRPCRHHPRRHELHVRPVRAAARTGDRWRRA